MSAGTKISRHKALKIAQPLVKILRRQPGVVEVVLAGSIRRGKPEVGDVDVTLFVDDRCSPYDLWRSLDCLNPTVVRGGACETGVVIDGLKFEIRLFSPAQRGAALLFTTGSGDFNQAMRTHAKRCNLLLNRYGLWTRDRTELIESETEESIFEALHLDFVAPEDRTADMWRVVNGARVSC